ncbi:MAG: S-layer homology domain-containing protein [Dehalobacterium sp.]
MGSVLMKKMRVVAYLMLVAMVFNILPVQALAQTVEQEQQREEQLKNELRKAVDETVYANGLFDFLTTRMNTSENLSFVEFAIVRKGGTEGKASITLKAIDVSAEYGKDYTLSISKGLLTDTLPENEDARPLMESMVDSAGNGAQDISVSGEVYGDNSEVNHETENEDNQGDTVREKVYSENREADATVEYEELPMQPAAGEIKSSGLRGAREAFTGKESDRKNWREVDRETKENALDLHKEMYEGMPGVTYTFNFEDGEYIKKIRFNTIDDKISEDEEQVLFALLNPTGAVVGDSLNAFMNIEDNEEKEKVEFEMVEDQISVDRNTGFAQVTVKRMAGLYRYGMINVGTAALTAKPNVDYEPAAVELRFVPGQETQKVRVPILAGDTEEEVQFIIKLDPESPNLSSGGKIQTVVTIKAPPRYLMQQMDENVQMMSQPVQMLSSMGTETLGGKTYRVKTLNQWDIVDGHHVHMNGWVYVPISQKYTYAWVYYVQDLTMVEKIIFDWSNPTLGTKYHPWWYVNPDYYNSFYSYFSFGSPYGAPAVEKYSTFNSYWHDYTLTDNDRKQNVIYIGSRTTGECSTSELNVGNVKLYYKPINVVLKSLVSDPDANITPQIWTSETSHANDQSIYVGALSFANTSPTIDRKAFYDGDTVQLAPQWAANPQLDSSKIYLWGYKIERKGGLEGDRYYKVKGDTLNIREIYTGNLKDVTGKKILRDEVLLDGDQICLLPVYKAKNAFVKINYDPVKGGMTQNSFSNGKTLKIGMLDTVKFNSKAEPGYAVSGYEHGDMNELLKEITTYEDERNLDTINADKGKQAIESGLSNLRPIKGININPAVPNELDFKPQKTYSNLMVQYSEPYLKVMVNPKSSNKDQGSIAYFPNEEGKTPQDGNYQKPLIISPIEKNKLYTINGAPKDGYSMIWKDWSGDVLKRDGSPGHDGELSEREIDYIGEYEHLFNRFPVNGNFFNYVPQYDKPLIYYSFVKKTPHEYTGLVNGKVVLKGGNILGGTNSQAVEKPLVGIEILINGFKVTTDQRGNFELENNYFAPDEYHTLIIDYKGIKYTGYILTDKWTKITIEEYDSFLPYNFKIFEETADGDKEVVPKNMENKDANFKFRFDVKPLKPGLSADKALIRIYSKEGVQRGAAIEVIPASGTFSFDFNPSSHNVVPGDIMTVQFVDQSGLAYLEHQVGFSFRKYLDTFSLLSSFKSPASEAIDMVGALDVAFDLGLAGKADKYIEKNNEEWTISFGFSKSWEKSLGGESPAEELKDAAKSSDPAKTEDTADKAIDKGNEEKKSASLTADMNFDLSTALYLRMTVDETGSAYFNELIMSATVDGMFGTKVEIVTPIGVTVFVALELQGKVTAMMVIEQYDDKKFYFNDQGEIDFSRAGVSDPNRDFTIYGKFIVQPSIQITVGAEIPLATFSIHGRADFDMNFTTSGSGSGNVTLSAGMALKVLVFNFEWEIARKTWELFNYGRMSSFNANTLFEDTNYLYDSAENYELISREYLENRGGWQGGSTSGRMRLMAVGDNAGNEQVLQTGVYPYPYTLLVPIGEDRQLLTFLDDDPSQDDRNRTQLYYSINNGTSWSQPVKVDDDNTPDDTSWIYDMGDKVLVAWSSAVDPVEESDSTMEVLNNRNIKARFFDKASQTFGEVQNVTYETDQDTYSDSDPYIAYWKDEETGKENLMMVYTKTEYKSTGSDDQDAVVGDIVNAYSALAYRFYDFENNCWDESGDLDDGFYGQGFLDVSEYVEVDESDLIITEEDNDPAWVGYWSREPREDELSIEELAADPLIVDSNAIGYENWAVLAYSIDMDQDTATSEDRELFIQLYNFTDKMFYPAVHFDDTQGQSNLVFVQANDNVYLCFISGGDIVSIDIGTLFTESFRNFLYYNLDGKDVFVLNKLKEVYRKPETIVRHTCVTRKDEAGNETKINEIPIDEFMVKADENNVYLVWGENDISYRDGIDPNSAEAAWAENYYREHHIYAAREILGEVTSYVLKDEAGKPMRYPAKDAQGNDIDYNILPDINGDVGQVQAGDEIIVRSRETQWSDPVQLTNEKGANFNDLDFVILSDSSLRVVFVKGRSEIMDIAGVEMSVENINTRVLMTADFDVSGKKAVAEIQPVEMPLPNEIVPVKVKLSNQGLSTLSDMSVELNQITGSITEKIMEEPFKLSLRGGETQYISTSWQAPDNPVDTKLQVVVKDGAEIIAGDEQDLIAESVIDVVDAQAEFISRNKLRITGTVMNNGNISSNEEQISAHVSAYVVGSENLGRIGVGDTKRFEFLAEVKPDMFENTANDDGSVTEMVKLNINSGGTGISLNCERYAAKQDMDIMNNIKTFELRAGSQQISDSISLRRGRTINIEPDITYRDASLPTPRLVYVSSNEDIADFSQGYMTLLGKSTGRATITAYALPQKSEMVLAEDRFEWLDNFATLPEAAVKVKSFAVNVVAGNTGNKGNTGNTGKQENNLPEGKNPIEPSMNKITFNDVAENAWYYDAVEFLAARGITTGTGNGNFNPEGKLTRAQFLVMTMRAYGITPDENPADNFADGGNTYYTGYLAAAKRLGLSLGIGGNLYAPDKEITRQEMFVLLYNALKLTNNLPQGTTENLLTNFSDQDKIASWAKDAITLFVSTGTINGSEGMLNLTNTTNRAEMAQVLYNLLADKE